MSCRRRLRASLCALALPLCAAAAQEPGPIDRVVVTATRRADRSFDVPAAVDAIDAATIRDARPMINLSEALSRVPGVVARNRQTCAQDLQVSSRGAWFAVAWTLSAFARLDNLFDRRYAGSVIVGDANGRHFEPAPGRAWFVGASASVRL